MQIQINSDNVTKVGTAAIRDTETRVQDTLGRFSSRLTRVEVHLRDHDGPDAHAQDGLEVMIEARPAGQKPLVASHRARSVDEAITGALARMTSRLETAFAKQGRAS